mmetsp:Transcript_16590/g.27421  ORF Transcript_16590/g.27421 Transcript_16590/m.27421 type:complete len:252 (-) Transcript_16590:40-795(-)|eukprot:CAMPEP_0184647590 /NCGR_PEP_ID=MMETSP0308-20130426/4561_1 /TAXON_ID=38269 /ORGANISM="Gloeochaete witrockiana, Strain SAG 46.84" /LENGTH=251 /DNA_ID=CAMNT_0027078703 /DNA_START=26 /DNA_END=781 /DNA_ORIENTATION=-
MAFISIASTFLQTRPNAPWTFSSQSTSVSRRASYRRGSLSTQCIFEAQNAKASSERTKQDTQWSLDRRSLASTVLALIAATTVQARPAYALNKYADTKDGYETLYPNGWIQYPFKKGGPDVAYRDIINQEETLSVYIQPVDREKKLETLGTPEEVGARIASSDGDTLLAASSREQDGVKFYDFEYEGGKLHKLATIAIARGKLFTLTLTASKRRWSKAEKGFQLILQTFKVYGDVKAVKKQTNFVTVEENS